MLKHVWDPKYEAPGYLCLVCAQGYIQFCRRHDWDFDNDGAVNAWIAAKIGRSGPKVAIQSIDLKEFGL